MISIAGCQVLGERSESLADYPSGLCRVKLELYIVGMLYASGQSAGRLGRSSRFHAYLAAGTSWGNSKMKNQYACDINDFKKYGLMRVITGVTKLRFIVNWMLTEDDGRTDGKSIEYLDNSEQWMRCDPELFAGLKKIVTDGERSVAAIKYAALIPNASYYEKLVPDDKAKRMEWSADFLKIVRGSDLVFFDPDNGLQVKSKPKGRKESSKFVFWDEIGAIWNKGCSILIYQHFPRQKKQDFITRTIKEVKQKLAGSSVTSFQTSNVLFIMATQLTDDWQKWNEQIATRCASLWNKQIQVS